MAKTDYLEFDDDGNISDLSANIVADSLSTIKEHYSINPESNDGNQYSITSFNSILLEFKCESTKDLNLPLLFDEWLCALHNAILAGSGDDLKRLLTGNQDLAGLSKVDPFWVTRSNLYIDAIVRLYEHTVNKLAIKSESERIALFFELFEQRIECLLRLLGDPFGDALMKLNTEIEAYSHDRIHRLRRESEDFFWSVPGYQGIFNDYQRGDTLVEQFGWLSYIVEFNFIRPLKWIMNDRYL